MRKIFIIITALILSLATFNLPAMATSGPSMFGEVQANILKDCASKSGDDNGSGIICILELVVDILTIGIGILSVIGISIVGVQYLTAGGSEEKTRKAKRRMLEIVIGLVTYVIIYTLLKFLLPNFETSSSGTTSIIINQIFLV